MRRRHSIEGPDRGVPTIGTIEGNSVHHRAETGRAVLHEFFRRHCHRVDQLREQRALFWVEHGLEERQHGVIDHVRLSLPARAVDADLRRLERHQFKDARVALRAKRLGPDEVVDPSPGQALKLRKADGVRVLYGHERTSVVVSLARLLGMTNRELHKLSESQVALAIQASTQGLLPLTTRLALLRGVRWGITEIALAVDVEESAPEYAKAYRSCGWKAVRGGARRFSTGLVWEGSENRLSVYDKGAEMRAHGAPGAPPAGTVMRVERQWRGVRAMTRLLGLVESSGRLPLPMVVQHSGHCDVRDVPVSHSGLHFALASELTHLDPPIPAMTSLQEVVTKHMRECRRFESMVRSGTSAKTVRRYSERMVEQEVRHRGLRSLVSTCYGNPRSLGPEIHRDE